MTGLVNEQDSPCFSCGDPSGHKYCPCAHTVCGAHRGELAQGGILLCGICDETVERTSQLPRPPPTVDEVPCPVVHIADDTHFDKTQWWVNDTTNMNGYGAPNGAYSNTNQNTPFYRGTFQTDMHRSEPGSDENLASGPRYVPPHMRGEESDIVRPESSMSNMTNNTFATQAPMGNYSYGPTQLAQGMLAFNPFIGNGGPSSRTPQLRPYMGGSHSRNGASSAERSNMYTRTAVDGHVRSACQDPARASGGNNLSAGPPPTIIAQPTPVRCDSGASTPTRAEYLASRIRQGHADDPFDPDYGNPGPTRRPAPAPKPIPFPQYNSPSENPMLPIVNGKKIAENTEGNPKAFIDVDKVPLPAWLGAAITSDSPPTIEQAFDSLPFIEACRYAVPSTAGVVKIVSIPYATTRAEVNAFLGKNIKIAYQPVGSGFQAVHIVMDRHSGKTMDAFIEVATHSEAIWVVNQFQKRVAEKRPPKVGGRIVEVALSNQDELMATLFPRAKQVSWKNGVPAVDPKKDEFYPGIFSEGFKGFLQDDEIYHMYQHAEKPQRSPFVTRCMVRHYEYLITTIHKYPWFAHEHVFLKEREMFFGAVHASIVALIALLRRNHGEQPDNSKPSATTLAELVTVTLVCPGFTDAQKASVVGTLMQTGFGKYTDDRAIGCTFGGLSGVAREVPFEALVIKPGVDDQVVNYFATLISDATAGQQVQQTLSLADLHAMNASQSTSLPSNNSKFGSLNIDYSKCSTVADAGRAELRYLEQVLGRVLPSSRRGSTLGRGSSGGESRVSSLRLSS